MISGLENAMEAAEEPAMMADAHDCIARVRLFSSSTKTKSPPAAESMLAMPVISIAPSPITRPCTNSAISFRERFIASLYTFGRRKERHKPGGLQFCHATPDVLALCPHF